MRNKKQRATLKQGSLFSGQEREKRDGGPPEIIFVASSRRKVVENKSSPQSSLEESSGRGAGTEVGPCSAKASFPALQPPTREHCPVLLDGARRAGNSISFPDHRVTMRIKSALV